MPYPRARDPLSVEYDDLVNRFLDRISLAGLATESVMISGGAIVPGTNTARAGVLIPAPPRIMQSGDDYDASLTNYQRAFQRSLYYWFNRAVYEPSGVPGRPRKIYTGMGAVAWIRCQFTGRSPYRMGYEGAVITVGMGKFIPEDSYLYGGARMSNPPRQEAGIVS